MTFDPHPMAVLRPEHAPPTLTSIHTRAAAARGGRRRRDPGAAASTGEIAAGRPRSSSTGSSSTRSHAGAVVVGANFRFGAKAAGRGGDPRRGRARRATSTTVGVRPRRRAPGVELDLRPQLPGHRRRRRRRRGAGAAVHRPRHGRRGRQARPRARLPDRQRPDPAGRRRTGRRGVRRLADPPRHGGALPRGDLGRHQPDLRRRARAPGRVLRPRPRRPRALRRRGRGGLRRPAARDGQVRGRRGARSRPCTTTYAARARSWRDARATGDTARSRSGSSPTACPTSWPRSGRPRARACARAGSCRSWCCSCVVAAAAGAAAGGWASERRTSAGPAVWLTVMFARPALATPRPPCARGPILGVRAAPHPREPAASWCRWPSRALPLLLLFVTFLFINAEAWEMTSNLPFGTLWLTVLLLFGAGRAVPAVAAARGGGPGRRRGRRRVHRPRVSPVRRWSRPAARWPTTPTVDPQDARAASPASSGGT